MDEPDRKQARFDIFPESRPVEPERESESPSEPGPPLGLRADEFWAVTSRRTKGTDGGAELEDRQPPAPPRAPSNAGQFVEVWSVPPSTEAEPVEIHWKAPVPEHPPGWTYGARRRRRGGADAAEP